MEYTNIRELVMLDLCCGYKGASSEMMRRGWNVVSLDVNPAFNPSIVCDVRKFVYSGTQPDLVWASPPCTEFSREFMPWCKTGDDPDLSIMLGCKRVIDEVKPRFWVIENVKGAIKWFNPILGKYAYSNNPFFLWGEFPRLPKIGKVESKQRVSSKYSAVRSMVPYELSKLLAEKIEEYYEWELVRESE